MTAENMTLRHVVDDLEALRVHLKQERLFLMGHSWGGMLAMVTRRRFRGGSTGSSSSVPADRRSNSSRGFEDNIHMRLLPEDRARPSATGRRLPSAASTPIKRRSKASRPSLPGYFFDRVKALAFRSQLQDGSVKVRVNVLLFGDMAKGYDLAARTRQARSTGPDRPGSSRSGR